MTDRRKFLLQTTLATGALMVGKQSGAIGRASAWIASESEKDDTFVLIHTNDIRSKLHPENGSQGFYAASKCIRSLKSRFKHTVLLDAGNSFCGDRRKKDTHGEILGLMNQVGYDAILPGVRDLKCGTTHLAEQLRKNNIPAIASNYRIKESSLDDCFMPYKIIRKGKFVIGIIGAGRNLKDHNVNVPMNCHDPISEASQTATMLKSEKGCHLVVCMSQLGFKNSKAPDDFDLARKSKDIDVIIGGYSCTTMKQPTIVFNQNRQEVIVNQAGSGGQVVGTIQIRLNEEGKKTWIAFKNHFVGSTPPAHS